MPRPRRVRIALEPSMQEVVAGQRVRFRLHVRNPAANERRVIVRLRDPSGDWRASLPLRDVRVPPSGAVTLFLRVDAPHDASPGERHTFQVVAAAVDEPDRPARLDVEAVIGSERSAPRAVAKPGSTGMTACVPIASSPGRGHRVAAAERNP